MSKKVVTFLVLLACVTAVVILMARQGRPPVTVENAATRTEAPAASEENKPDGLTGNEEIKAAETAAAPAPASEEKTSEAQTDDAAPVAGEVNDADKTEEAKTEEAAASEEPKPIGSEVRIEPNAVPPANEPIGNLLSPSASTLVDMDNALAERAMGDPDAPVVMIEYASMTCPHCARFHNQILEKVKASLIDTGKLRLIFRDYPLDTHALRAAMMARCTDRARYFNLVEVIFKNQDRWVKSTDPLSGLKQLGALAGMDPAFIDNCIKNPELEKFILSGMQEAQRKYKIKATPTFIFNNDAEQLSGDQNPEDFERVVNKLMKKKGK